MQSCRQGAGRPGTRCDWLSPPDRFPSGSCKEAEMPTERARASFAHPGLSHSPQFFSNVAAPSTRSSAASAGEALSATATTAATKAGTRRCCWAAGGRGAAAAGWLWGAACRETRWAEVMQGRWAAAVSLPPCRLLQCALPDTAGGLQAASSHLCCRFGEAGGPAAQLQHVERPLQSMVGSGERPTDDAQLRLRAASLGGEGPLLSSALLCRPLRFPPAASTASLAWECLDAPGALQQRACKSRLYSGAGATGSKRNSSTCCGDHLITTPPSGRPTPGRGPGAC